MNRLFRFFLAVLAVLAPAGYAGAHSSTPVLIQVTRNTVGEIEAPKIRSQQGSSIVFVSDGDVLGPGTAPGHREVYMYSAESGAITRITNTVAGESYEASRETDDVNSGRDVLVAFVSTGDFDPSVGNADHNPEIFLWFEQDGSFLQVTDTVAPVVNGEVYASESGKCLTFRSNADLDDNDGSDVGNPGRGFGNADGSDEVFNLSFGDNDLDRNFWVTTQVSNGPAGTASSHPVVGGYWFTRQCRSNAYQSDHDQLGNGSSGSHIYNYTKNTGVIEQLSKPGAGINRNPAMSSASNFARGPFVVYETDTDPIGNGSSSYELFRFRLFKNELWQYTFATEDSARPAISDGGGRMTFESKADLFRPNRPLRTGDIPPFNSDANPEIFLTKGKHQITQVTETVGCENNFPTLRDTGDAVAFRSTCDLVGLNPGGVPQVFHYVLVDRDDPLATTAGCQTADGCCNEANGCFYLLFGAKQSPPREGIHPDY
ncbi:MAG TPA: hypothetical protein VN634_08115 [Candidatus Limnocylindrales bacterium]|nr:hypothetical protein [Candidatus Limnocylindrales bacterium]